MSKRRCICGRSSTLPLCDGAHSAEGWRCSAPSATRHARIFASGVAYQTVAERLAHAYRGTVLHQLRGQVAAEELVVVTSGVDLEDLRPSLARVEAETTRILVVGADPLLVGGAVPEARVSAVSDSEHPAVFWRRLVEAMEGKGTVVARSSRLFLSHATVDEARLQPAVDALRGLGVSVFSCGDSIPGGTRWRDQIVDALRACDRVVFVLSPAARSSTWCAFELGVAVALGKPLQLVSLDGLPPPSFLAHLQMQDVPRMLLLRPWLEYEDALLESVLALIPGAEAVLEPTSRMGGRDGIPG